MALWIERIQQQIGLRLALACFILSFLIACAITGIQLWQKNSSSKAEATLQLQQIEKLFLPGLIEAMWTLDPARLDAQLAALQQLPLVSRIVLVNDSNQSQEYIVHPSSDILMERQYPLTYSINGDTFALGSLTVELDATGIHAQLAALAQSSLLSSFGALFLGSLLLLWLFHGWVTRQLQQVAEFAKRLNADNLATPLELERSKLHTQDEIGSIVTAMTQMQNQLREEFSRREQAETELKAYQSQLEKLVTERTRQLEAQTTILTQQSRQLLEQNAELNAFAHTVAHDLKHPLSSMIGMSTLLNQASSALSANQQQQFITEIHDSSVKMNGMINSLLQLASLRSDARIESTQVNMQTTLQDAIKNLGSLIAQHNCHIDCAENLPVVWGNPHWIEEIWLNYLSNAIKYGGNPAKVEVGFDVPSTETPYWRFWVRDHGEGVPKEREKLMFEEFSRLHAARADSHGLGLSIVRRICNRLGGQCGYQAATGGGSLFWFSLPMKNEPAPAR